MGGKKLVSRAIVCAVAVGAVTGPAYAAGEGLGGGTVGEAVEQVAQSLPPVEIAPLPDPVNPAPPAAPALPAPAPAPAAPAPASPPAAPSSAGSTAPATSASSARSDSVAHVRGRDSDRPARAGAAAAKGTKKAAASQTSEPAREIAAASAQADETADPVETGAQPSADSGEALPFTGSDLALLAALGLLVLTAGLLLRRAAAV